MKCVWQTLINILPVWLREDVNRYEKAYVEEIRLRLNQPTELVFSNNRTTLGKQVTLNDLQFCINVTSRYSPWAAGTIADGYLTAPGGHRVGVCGEAVITNGKMSGIRTPRSICIRVAKDFPGIAANALNIDGSILIIGAPGCGKTTLLRDLIRLRSDKLGYFISVVDEKEELFPFANNEPCFYPGRHTDILSGCSKEQGIMTALRNMSPQIIAVDEITAAKDCDALLHAGWCGVSLLATAHAGNIQDLTHRPIYKPLIHNRLFDTIIVMKQDKSWTVERINI